MDEVIEVKLTANAIGKLRYAELVAEKAVLVAQLQPFRDDYERLTNDPRLIECRAAIKALSNKLAPVDNELAALTRVMGGRSLQG